MKNIFFSIILSLICTTTLAQNFHDIKIQSINGQLLSMNDFKGKYVLVVNVASKCGYTKQYAELEELHQLYENLVVLGVPCTQFAGWREIQDEKQILQFCTDKYDVTFPMTSKVEVKGTGKHPLYQWLTEKEYNKKDNYKINWNFNKFIVDPNGQLLEHFKSGIKPLSEEITSILEK